MLVRINAVNKTVELQLMFKYLTYTSTIPRHRIQDILYIMDNYCLCYYIMRRSVGPQSQTSPDWGSTTVVTDSASVQAAWAQIFFFSQFNNNFLNYNSVWMSFLSKCLVFLKQFFCLNPQYSLQRRYWVHVDIRHVVSLIFKVNTFFKKHSSIKYKTYKKPIKVHVAKH